MTVLPLVFRGIELDVGVVVSAVCAVPPQFVQVLKHAGGGGVGVGAAVRGDGVGEEVSGGAAVAKVAQDEGEGGLRGEGGVGVPPAVTVSWSARCR
ncbi:hypothetical protein AB0B85_23030 [Micromonospora sp. NPDC049044]|uniref:hypothetical protein n=1 Tax=Micromonospora sp. NPDC049044 TaxID=3154827 RepID=UPI0033C13A92